MAKTTNEMIRTYLPLFILVGTIIAGWVRLQSGLEAMTIALEKHCVESSAEKAVVRAAIVALEKEDGATAINMTEMKKDLEYIRIDYTAMQKDIEGLRGEFQTGTNAILTKLKEALDEP